MKQLYRSIVIAASLLAAAVPISHAAMAEVHFSGVVTSKSSTASGVLGTLQVGDRLEGVFSYDTAGAVDTNDWSVVGQYPFTAANSVFSLTVYAGSSATVMRYTATGYLDQILTEDNWNVAGYPVIDAFTPKGALPNGVGAYLYFQNRDTQLDFITSDALPEASTIDIANYNYTKGTIFSATSIGQVYFDITSTNVSAVPEPSTLCLMVAGLGLVGAAVRRGQRRNR